MTWVQPKPIVPFNARGTNFQNMYYFAKSQNKQVLKFLLSATKFKNAC